ncbi:MAG TPA: sialidase family protein [Ktedonobacterales bacterium]
MPHDDAAPAPNEAADDDLVFSREPLDTPSFSTVADSTPARPLNVWPRALSRRQKALRAAIVVTLFAATLVALLGGPAALLAGARSLSAALDARLHPPQPLPMLARHGYTAIKSPPGAYNLPNLSLAPAVSPAGAAWVCWTTPFTSHKDLWTPFAYYTDDSGATWRPLTLPQPVAQNCQIVADGENGSAALLLLTPQGSFSGACPTPSVYLTTDTGATWTQIPLPFKDSPAACGASAALRDGALYLWADQPLLGEASPFTPPTARIIVSRDAGRTWAPADDGLDDSVGFAIVGFRPGGRILATIADPRVSGGATRLMESGDYGATWRDLGPLPGAFAQVYAADDNAATDHGGWGQLYTVSRAESHGVPTVPATYRLATAYVGQRWTPIPLPPTPATIEQNPQSLEPIALAVGPGGALELERGIVESRDAQFSPSRLLWLWSPARQMWLLDPLPVPGNLQAQGDSWRAGDQTIWVTTLQLGVPPILQISTKVTLASDVRPR